MLYKVLSVIHITILFLVFLPREVEFDSGVVFSVLMLILHSAVYLFLLRSFSTSVKRVQKYFLGFFVFLGFAVNSITYLRIEFGYATEFEGLVYFALLAVLFIASCVSLLFPMQRE